MVMLNDLDLFNLVTDVTDRVPGLTEQAGTVRTLRLETDGRARARRESGERVGDEPAGRVLGSSLRTERAEGVVCRSASLP